MVMAPASDAFWTEYKTLLTKLSISEKKSNYYVFWARRFEGFLNGMPLREGAPARNLPPQ
jgi:hypothetical protein